MRNCELNNGVNNKRILVVKALKDDHAGYYIDIHGYEPIMKPSI